MLELYTRILTALAGVREREEGQTAVEYALVLALIAVVLVGVLATGLDGVIDDVIAEIQSKI